MSRRRQPDWDARSDAVLADPLRAYDEMRQRCPVAYDEPHGWSLFRHADVLRVLEDYATFSNVVSKHHSVPNGMDPPEHSHYRRAIEPFFGAERMRLFEPICREIARSLSDALPALGTIELMQAFALPFAVRCQCAFLGWPNTLAEPLLAWMRDHQAAAAASDRAALTLLAAQFKGYVQAELKARREMSAAEDVMFELMHTDVCGAPLSEDDLTSILRNWTVGEIGSLAASIGIVASQLAHDEALQQRLKESPTRLAALIDELLRIEGPLLSNRRRATREVTIGGRTIAEGEMVTLMWVSANRDEQVFEGPAEVRLDREPSANLLYGAGIHVCPGAPLARLELRVAFEELLRGSRRILSTGVPALRAVPPATGWAHLPLQVVE